jgi:predicted lysophospholipase L1 biosynthesis ABC-type transport system permease subunit
VQQIHHGHGPDAPLEHVKPGQRRQLGFGTPSAERQAQTQAAPIRAALLERPEAPHHHPGGFAVVALLLACVGVCGVTAYSVALRRHEFGLRLALGARSGQVLSLVIREVTRLTVAGLLLGLVGALIAARALRG